jgi:hypothetical protein
MVSRWSVVAEHQVDAADMDAGDAASDRFRDGLIDSAVRGYLAQCAALDEQRRQAGAELRVGAGGPRGALRLRGASTVMVLASTVEVMTTSFIVAVRIRPSGGEAEGGGEPLDVRCAVGLVDAATGGPLVLDRAIRDELIALEHAAGHMG